MSDRTRVYLTIADEHISYLKQIIQMPDYRNEWDTDLESESDGKRTIFNFEDVNYGTLDFLPELLARGIAYESSWCAGDEYTEGTEYCRFYKDSTATTIQVYNDEINPHLPTLMSLLSTPYELINFIELHYKQVTPPSWDNQIEYGKLYQIQQLLLGNTI